MSGSKALWTLKIMFGLLCIVVLASHVRLISQWSEARGVYDDICYLRQAHLFQRFGLAGFDTDMARDDDGYLKSKLKEIGFPTWNDPATAPCHNFMPATGKLSIQYPPGVGLVLAAFPAGHQVAPMYALAVIVVCGFALRAILLARSVSAIIIAGAFSFVAVYVMINPIKASYSMAPTAVLCALAGFLVARWLTGRQRGSNLLLILPLGFLFGLSVDFRLANLFLAFGCGLFLLLSFLKSWTARSFWQGVAFAVAFIAGVAPTIASYWINTGSPFTSTYSGAPDVKPLDFSFSVVRDYLHDPLQVALLFLSIAGSLYLLRRGEGCTRVALVTLANLAVNLAFFLTYPIATPYYTLPISLLSLWTLVFAQIIQDGGERSLARQRQNAT